MGTPYCTGFRRRPAVSSMCLSVQSNSWVPQLTHPSCQPYLGGASAIENNGGCVVVSENWRNDGRICGHRRGGCLSRGRFG
jgi:hypothetical protein